MPDDVNINGSFDASRRGGGMFNRAMGRGGSHNVSASLKFDIPGLQDFKKQLTDINVALGNLDKTFAKLAKGPEAFSKQLENVVKQMKVLQAQQIQGNRFVTTGTPPSRDPVGQATAAAQAAGGNGNGSGGAGGGAGGKGSGAGVAQLVTKGIESLMKRFDAGMQQGIAADVYSSRMASFTGTSSQKNFSNQGKHGFGFMATDFVQGNQVQYQGTGIGAYVGASGRPGQWGQAYTQSIKQMQELMPGLDATQGANTQTSIYGNVQGIKLGRALLGAEASPYKSNGTGERKTQGDYFRGILNGLQRQPRPNGQNGAWSKEDIMKQNFPGSRLNAWLATILPEDAIPMWYEWAINNAAAGGNLSDDPKQAKKQLESIRGGRSLATNAQETTNREAQKDAKFAGEQYGAMNARLDYEKQMLGVLESIDSKIGPAYGLAGRVPSLLQGPVSGAIGGIISGITSLFGGDPGYMPMGDPEGGTSHLTPDLRKRVNTMMAANPNLKISSAYRDNKRQGDLQGKGPFAPPGKSKHGRGQAVDFGTQLGWVAKNARKFGLETAERYGEPWHVQLAGTTTMGDPIDPSATARQSEAAMRESLIGHAFATWRAGQASAPSASTGATGATGGTADSTTGTTSGSGNFTPGEGGALSVDQIVELLHTAGFSGEALVKMAGISNRESSWKPGAYNPDASTGDNSLGLWQINVLGKLAETRLPLIKNAGGSKIEDLYDPLISAKVAYQMWQASGFQPWGPYKGVSELHNVSQSALDTARAAAEAHGYMGDVGYAPQMSGNGGSSNVTVSGGQSVVFHNTFQLAFPNGATKQSIDTATRQIAQRLEPQISRLVSRNN